MDLKAFDRIDKSLRPLMHSELTKNFAIIANEHEEVLQETFIKIFKQLKEDKYQGRASLKNWAMIILRNTAFDCVRKYKKSPQGNSSNEEELENLQADHSFIEDSDSECIKKALKFLAIEHPEAHNELLLIATSGMNLKQLAEMHSIAHGTARQRISQYRKQLKGYIMKFCEQKQ